MKKKIKMNKKHIITIAGDIASGKGTVAEILREELKYKIYSNGQSFRKLAIEQKMTVRQFNQYVSDHPEIDLKIEDDAKKYIKSHDNVIVDARLGWFIAPDSFKIYLKVDLDESARRVLNDLSRGKVEKYDNFEQARKQILERYELENDRYFELYGIHKDDLSNYDLIVDTTNISPKETADEILREYRKWLSK